MSKLHDAYFSTSYVLYGVEIKRVTLAKVLLLRSGDYYPYSEQSDLISICYAASLLTIDNPFEYLNHSDKTKQVAEYFATCATSNGHENLLDFTKWLIAELSHPRVVNTKSGPSSQLTSDAIILTHSRLLLLGYSASEAWATPYNTAIYAITAGRELGGESLYIESEADVEAMDEFIKKATAMREAKAREDEKMVLQEDKINDILDNI